MGPPLAQANALEALSKLGRFSRVIVGPQALEFLSDHWEVVELSGPDGIKGFEITGKPVG